MPLLLVLPALALVPLTGCNPGNAADLDAAGVPCGTPPLCLDDNDCSAYASGTYCSGEGLVDRLGCDIPCSASGPYCPSPLTCFNGMCLGSECPEGQACVPAEQECVESDASLASPAEDGSESSAASDATCPEGCADNGT